MKIQSTIVLLVLFVVVFGIFAVVKLTDQPTAEERAQYRDRIVQALYNVEPDDVDRVLLRRGEEEIELVHDEMAGRWQITRPLNVLADSSRVRDIINDLRNLTRKSNTQAIVPRSGDASSLAPYGLGEPAKTVELHVKAAQGQPARTVTVHVGQETPDGFGLHVKVTDDRPVFVVNKSSLESLDRKLVELRRRELLSISRFDANSLHLAWPQRELTAEKRDGKWWLVTPIEDRADDTQLGGIIDDLRNFKAESDEDFVDNDVTPEDLAQYGLDEPQLVAEIRKRSESDSDDDEQPGGKAGRVLVEKLLVGDPVEGRTDRRYAKLDDQGYVVAVSAKALDTVQKTPSELRSRKLVELATFDVDFLRIEQATGDGPPAGKVVLGKPDFDWKLYQPKSADGDSSAIDEFLRTLSNLQVREFLDQAEPADYGLKVPSFVVSVWENGISQSAEGGEGAGEDSKEAESDQAAPPTPKGEPIRISLGRHDPDQNRLYALCSDRPGVLAVNDEILSTLEAGYLAFRDKGILDFISTSEVAQIDVVRDGQTVTLVRRKEGEAESAAEQWHMTKPVSAPANQSAADNVITNLSSLRAEKLVVEKTENLDLAQYGLAEPALRITVTEKAQESEKAEQPGLLIGNSVAEGGESSAGGPEQYYAMEPDGELVFTIAADKVDSFRAELRDPEIFSFSPSDVQALTVTYPGRQIELRYAVREGQSEKEWVIVGEADFKLDTEKAAGLVRVLSTLEADRFVQYEGGPEEGHGLSQPSAVIELTLAGDEKKTLRIGAASAPGFAGGPPDKESRFAAADHLPGAVFLIEADEFGPVATDPDYLAAESLKAEAAKESEADQQGDDKVSEKETSAGDNS